MNMKKANNDINSDHKKRCFALLFVSAYRGANQQVHYNKYYQKESTQESARQRFDLPAVSDPKTGNRQTTTSVQNATVSYTHLTLPTIYSV